MNRTLFNLLMLPGFFLVLIAFIYDEPVRQFLLDSHNPIADYILGWFANFTSVFVILILITTLFLFEERKREWIPPLWIAFFLAGAVSVVVKVLIARVRPSMLEVPFEALQYSFPSMHAMVSFAVLPILIKEFRELTWFWIMVASIISFSRLYFDYHYLSDVLFGVFVGILIGTIVVYLEQHHKAFKFKHDKTKG